MASRFDDLNQRVEELERVNAQLVLALKDAKIKLFKKHSEEDPEDSNKTITVVDFDVEGLGYKVGSKRKDVTKIENKVKYRGWKE